MEYLPLGSSGPTVSRMCLGTMLFGSQCDEAASRSILDSAEDLGINFIDTANIYPVPAIAATWGVTESIVGRWLRDRNRADFILATKFGFPVGDGPQDRGGSRAHVLKACEDSLRRLGTDYVDVYWIHVPDNETPIEETLEALGRLVEVGMVRYIGASNFEAWRLAFALGLASAGDALPRFIATQERYSLLARSIERDTVPMCQATGLGLVAYNPLAAGLLSGRYRPGSDAPPGSRFSQPELARFDLINYWSGGAIDTAAVVARLASEAGLSPVRLALSWLFARPATTTAIVGASRPEQLAESVGAISLRLSDEIRAKLDRLTSGFVQ